MWDNSYSVNHLVGIFRMGWSNGLLGGNGIFVWYYAIDPHWAYKYGFRLIWKRLY